MPEKQSSYLFLSFEPISDSCNKQQVSWVCFWRDHTNNFNCILQFYWNQFSKDDLLAPAEKGQQKTGENSDLQKYNRQWLFPMSCCLCEENGGTRTVPNKIESEKWKHAEQLTLPDLGGQGRGECREITNLFYLYSKKIFKFNLRKKRHLAK